MRRFPAVLAATGICAVVAACGSSSATSSGGAGSALVIGAPVSLEGANVVTGQYTLHGYQYCATVVNSKGGVTYGGQSHQLQIKTQDDQSLAANDPQVLDQFNDAGIQFVLSPYGSAATSEAAAEAEKNGQILVDSNGADLSIFSHGYQNTFGVLSPSSTYVTSIVQALAGLNPAPHSVAIIAASDGFSQTAASAGQAAAQKAGWTILPAPDAYKGSTKVAANAQDVSSALEAIGTSNPPDVIIISAHVVEAEALLKQSSELGVKPKLGFAATVAVPDLGFLQAAGKPGIGVLGSTQWVPQLTTSDNLFGSAKDFATGYTNQFGDVVGGVPAYQAADATAACLALVRAIQAANSTSVDAVRTALKALNFDSFYGHIQFDSTGINASKPMQVIQVQGTTTAEQLVTVYPAALAGGKTPVWPAIQP
jgi:branched-chain amino acid transport system substrate-binding protein